MSAINYKKISKNLAFCFSPLLTGAALLAGLGAVGCTGEAGNPDVTVNVTTGPTIVSQTQTNEQDQTTDTTVDQGTDVGTDQSADGGDGADADGADGADAGQSDASDGADGSDTDGGDASDTSDTTAPPTGGVSVSPDFYAIYDRILDTTEIDDPFNIHLARMSNDGTRVFVVNGAGDNNDRRGWYLADPAGAARTEFDLPDGAGQIRHMDVSGDGARAFFSSGYEDEIYKWEGGAITTIDVSGTTGPGSLADLQTTEAGDELFLLDDWNLWRVGSDGSGLALLIEAAALSTAYGTGYRVWDIAVDDSGDIIAFLAYIRSDTGNFVDLFVWNAGTITQLSDDRSGYKEYLRISGDGSTIVYQDQATNEYVAISSTGTGRTVLTASSHNFGGMALTTDGATLVYGDNAARGGRRVDLAGGDVYEIMPDDILMAITDQLCMSGDGNRIMFIRTYSTSPLGQSVYIGHFDDAEAVADAPHISDLHLTPGQLTAGGTVVLDGLITDAQGADDIVDTGVDELAAGIFVGEGAQSPASFYDLPNDAGESGDTTAADGRYACRGGAGGRIAEFDAVTLRVSAQDASGTVVVADVTLPIGP